MCFQQHLEKCFEPLRGGVACPDLPLLHRPAVYAEAVGQLTLGQGSPAAVA